MALIDSKIEDYCVTHSTRPSEVAKELELHTRQTVHGHHMLIGEMEASILAFLIKLGRAKRILELGTFTGYSALIMAEQIPEDGKVTTIDINPHTTEIARKFWDRSPHGKKIELILKPGPEALAELAENFDLIFIDADKRNYSHYLQWGLDHLTPNGFIVVDNTLWSGKVLEESTEKQTAAIQAHNELVRDTPGLIKTLLPIRDGMFLIQKAL